MTFKGTKGKWRVIEGWNTKGEGKYFPSVVLFGPNDDGSLGRNRIVINVSHDQKVESLMANALVISKAPELLKFVKKVMNTHPDGNPIMLIEEARRLFKEATDLESII